MHCFEANERRELIGGDPNPYAEGTDDRMIHVFINEVIEPDEPYGSADVVRIFVL
jgi:hypothetical protein